MEVTLAQMLEAREMRAFRQLELSRKWKLPIISFSMNIPGPVKDSPLIRRGFWAGCSELELRLPREAVKEHRIWEAVTGSEAVYVVDMAPEEVKAITTAIEDEHGLGRLFDMDVLDTAQNKLDRELVGGQSRDCIVCGAPGRGCASRRVHSIVQLQGAVQKILTRYFAAEDRNWIGAAAVQSLLDEVHTTPKPGLVDRRNRGSHRDMDLNTFTASAAALRPYFTRCAETGMETAGLTPWETFGRLRAEGLQAEKAMYAVTGGINTHKGAIFTMGLLCGAAGRLWTPEGTWDAGKLCREVSAMTKDAMEADLARGEADTAGTRIFRACGIRGIRGEVALGLPSVTQIGLPAYRACRARGASWNDAGVVTLLHLIANVEDTCLIHRGGLDGAAEAARRVSDLLREAAPQREEIEAMDDWFIRRNLSPGGCADLLAAVYFVYSLENRGDSV